MSDAVKEPLREAFEAAVRAEHGDGEYAMLVLQRGPDGRYSTVWVDHAWWGWQEATRRASAREAAIIAAASEVLQEALDDVRVHPCDQENDSVRAQGLWGPYRKLWDAFAAAAPEQKPEAQ